MLRIDRTAKIPPPSRRWIWTAAAVLLLIAIGAGSLWLIPSRASTVRVAVAREVLASDSLATVLNASGYVAARRRATVSSKITGKLVDVRVEEGMDVSLGQLLARLDDSHFRARLALAQSQTEAARMTSEETSIRLELAELTLSRTRRLVAEGVSDRASLDEAEAEAGALRASLDLNREQVTVAEREALLRETELADTVIRAPFGGVVISKDAQPGEMVSPNSAGGGFTRTGICTIVDMNSLEIEVDVNESYISRVHPGQPVEAVLDAYPDWRIAGKVITTVPAADRQKATVLVRIGFEQLDPRILPDMGVSVAFREAQVEAQVEQVSRLVIPRGAIGQDGGQEIVFVVNGDTLERRAIRTGGESADGVEVIAGLTSGERVVLDSAESLVDGDRVRVE